MRESTITVQLLFSAVTITLGTWFVGGYTSTLVNAPEYEILLWIRSVKCSRHFVSTPDLNTSKSLRDGRIVCGELPRNVTADELKEDHELDIIWGMIGCALNLGCVISLPVIQILMSRCSFKLAMHISNGVTGFGAILSGCCIVAHSYEMLIVGRLICGIGLGVSGTVILPYLAEISPTEYRGAIGTFLPLASSFGMLMAAVFGMPRILGSAHEWPALSWVVLLPCLIMGCSLFILPDSPRYLLLIKKDERKARDSLKWLRGGGNTEKEFQVIQEENASHMQLKEASVSPVGVMRDRIFRKSLLTCVVAITAEGLSGYVAVYTYSTGIFMQAGLTSQEALYGTIGLMALQLVFNALGALAIDRFGRRPLLLWGNLGCVLATALLTLTTVLAQRGTCPNCQYGSLAALFFFIIVFNLGPISVPLVLASEMFPKAAKESAVTISIGFLHGSSAIIGVLFPVMQSSFKEWTFLFFTGVYSVCTIYLWFALIETKGRTFEEIQRDILKHHIKRSKDTPQQSGLRQRRTSRPWTINSDEPASPTPKSGSSSADLLQLM